jgi:hypothetical protein
MKRLISLAILTAVTAQTIIAQIDAGLFRYPDVSKTSIVFTYANDLWMVPKDGGTAIKLSSPAGVCPTGLWIGHQMERKCSLLPAGKVAVNDTINFTPLHLQVGLQKNSR